MESLHQRLGPHAKADDLVEWGAEYTLQYDPSEEKLQHAKMFHILDKEPKLTP